MVSLVIWAIVVPIAAQTPKPATGAATYVVQPPPSTYHFPNGQSLHYAVDWRVFTAGTATIRMEAAGQEQRITAAADAAGVVALLYHVQDRFESFFDPTTFCSRSVSKHTEEGFRRLETGITFDYVRRKSVLSERNLKKNESKTVENDIPTCVTDVLSSLFYVSSLPLAAGASYQFPANDGGHTIAARATVEGREEVKTPAGTFKTIRVQISSDSRPLKDRGILWAWYTDDAARTPVQMRSRLGWGTLLFRLQRVENSRAK